MNILIPLGTGSPWEDNELRYCLRSIEKHLTGWEKIIIVGKLPTWLKVNDKIQFIPMLDRPGAPYKELNIHRKIMAGIPLAGDQFLFMNDDHFLLQDIEAKDFPYHHKGMLSATIAQSSRHNPYYKSLRNTFNTLGDIPNYDTHCPIIYDALTYRLKVDAFKFPTYGYCIKTLYCHYADIEGSYYPDCKLSSGEGIEERTAGRMYFSIGNKAIGPELQEYLEQLYPNPSQFE